MYRPFRSVLLSAAALLPAGPVLADDLRVVASIKPVHSLVAAVMAGVGEPTMIVRGAASPHSYSLRPSDAQALQEADVVVWIGPGMEVFLAGAVATLAPDAASVPLREVDGLVLLPIREGGSWDAHDHDAEHGDHEAHADEHASAHDDEHHDDHAAEHGDGHDDEHDGEHAHDDDAHYDERGDGMINAHLWLDPHNAAIMVEAIAAALAEADPTHADAYRANGAETVGRLEALEGEIAARLEPVASEPFVVFHDAYRYMEERFGLNAVGSITVSPEVQPGAGRLREIRARIEGLGATCVFAEPQFTPALVDTLVEGTSARSGVLDPLGADLADGPDQYFELMRRNADALRSCLEGVG